MRINNHNDIEKLILTWAGADYADFAQNNDRPVETNPNDYRLTQTNNMDELYRLPPPLIRIPNRRNSRIANHNKQSATDLTTPHNRLFASFPRIGLQQDKAEFTSNLEFTNNIVKNTENIGFSTNRKDLGNN